jgi:hypothetical protein
MKFINNDFNEDDNFIPFVEYRRPSIVISKSYINVIDINKNVTFNNTVSVILIPTHKSLNNISENKLWYNDDDYQCFKNEIINENRWNRIINNYINYIEDINEKINENIQDPLMF